jgi:protein-S-isoprenylcysteine O-methyltransferase Ste14
MFILGFIIILVGFLIRILALKSLKHNFTSIVFPNKELVISGLYFYMRHPMYFGSLLMFLGIIILDMIVAIFILCFFYFYDRMKKEDINNMIHEGFEVWYNKTGMFCPRYIRRFIKWLS